jgi:hypothetical protein
MVLWLGYSGLRIRDAVTLRRERLQNGKLMQKTGIPVCVSLPVACRLGASRHAQCSLQLLHRFRDTVKRLLADVSIDRVSVFLRHSRVKITEGSYAPWVKAHQDQLEAVAMRTGWRSEKGFAW